MFIPRPAITDGHLDCCTVRGDSCRGARSGLFPQMDRQLARCMEMLRNLGPARFRGTLNTSLRQTTLQLSAALASQWNINNFNI